MRLCNFRSLLWAHFTVQKTQNSRDSDVTKKRDDFTGTMDLAQAMGVLRTVSSGKHDAELAATAASLQAGATVAAPLWRSLDEALAVVMGRRSAPCVAPCDGPLAPRFYSGALLAVTVDIDGRVRSPHAGANAAFVDDVRQLLASATALYAVLVDRAHAVQLADDGARTDHGWALRLASDVDQLRRQLQQQQQAGAPSGGRALATGDGAAQQQLFQL